MGYPAVAGGGRAHTKSITHSTDTSKALLRVWEGAIDISPFSCSFYGIAGHRFYNHLFCSLFFVSFMLRSALTAKVNSSDWEKQARIGFMCCLHEEHVQKEGWFLSVRGQHIDDQYVSMTKLYCIANRSKTRPQRGRNLLHMTNHSHPLSPQVTRLFCFERSTQITIPQKKEKKKVIIAPGNKHVTKLSISRPDRTISFIFRCLVTSIV